MLQNNTAAGRLPGDQRTPGPVSGSYRPLSANEAKRDEITDHKQSISTLILSPENLSNAASVARFQH